MAKLQTDPLPSPEANRPAIGLGVAIYARACPGLYVEQYWPIVTKALAAAENGDGSGLLDLYDTYLERQPDGTWSNAFEGLIAINCLDDPGPTRSVVPRPPTPRNCGRSRRTSGDWAAYDYSCIYWPAPQKPPIKLTGAGAGPIVVVGTTGDPITPIESTKNMADRARGRRPGHGAGRPAHRLRRQPAASCPPVDDYLIDLTAPQSGLFCS